MDPVTTEGHAVTENVRKRTSKWDLVADTHFSTAAGQENSQSVKEGGLYHDKESNLGWDSSRSSVSHGQKWGDMEVRRSVTSKDSSERPYWEPIPENRDQEKDGNGNRNVCDVSAVRSPCGGHKTYNSSTSPHRDEWRQGSQSRSPRRASNRSRRSRSPSRGFKRGVDGRNERSRSGSTVACKDFALGRSRRGSQCRYLHQDNHEYDSRRHHGVGPEENQRSRQDRGFPGRTNHGYGISCGGDQEKHESRRNSRSSIRCSDFTKGKCYRGSACKYVHDSVSADGYGGRSSKDATRERAHDRRDANISSDIDQRRGPRRNSETSCIYFAEGNCRNGENCRFSHQGPAVGGLDCSSQDDKCGHSWSTDNQFWESSMGSHRTADRSTRDSPKQRSGNCGARADAPENTPWNGSKWGDKAVPEKIIPTSPQWKNRSNGVGDGLPDDRSWNRRSDSAAADHVSNSLQWMSKDNSARVSNPESRAGEKFSGGRATPTRGVNSEQSVRNPPDLLPRNPEEDIKYQILPKEASEVVLPICKQNRNQEIAGQEHVSTALIPAVAAENAKIDQHAGITGGAVVFPCEEANQFTNSSKLQDDLNPENNISAMSPVWGQSFNQHSQSQQMVPQPPSVVLGFNAQGESQQTVLPSPNVQSFIPNGQSQHIMPQPPPMAHLQMQATPDELNRRPNLPESNVSQITSETPAPNVVTSEQVAQLTNISASLAQILGKGKNLPELYASLNHPDGTDVGSSQPDSNCDSVRPPAPMTTSFVQPNQDSWLQPQCDPISNSMELVNPEIDSQPPGFSSHSFEQIKSATEDSQAHLRGLVQPSVTNAPNDGCTRQNVDSEEEPQHGNQEPNQPEHGYNKAKEVGEEATGQSKKEQEIDNPKDMETEAPVDVDNKKNKDAKGMRVFKFALVEFTKEILKPTWKEGHMSKEAHKTIVKKVVEKVTGAMQGPQIPETQEKIDHYLSSSKSKLTKLVLAYVEKYLKT